MASDADKVSISARAGETVRGARARKTERARAIAPAAAAAVGEVEKSEFAFFFSTSTSTSALVRPLRAALLDDDEEENESSSPMFLPEVDAAAVTVGARLAWGACFMRRGREEAERENEKRG